MSRPTSAWRVATETAIERQSLRDCLQPLFIFMRLGGGNLSSPGWPRSSWRHQGLLAYSVFCTILVVCATARFALMFTPDLTYGDALFSRVTVMSVYTQAAIYQGISIVSWPKVIPFVDGLAEHARSIDTYRVKLYNGVRTLLALMIICSIVGSAIFLGFVFMPNMGPEVRMWAVPWDENDQEARISLSCLLFMGIPGLFALFSSEALYLVLSYCLFKEANHLANEMKTMTCMKRFGDDTARQLSFYRQVHSDFADIMDEADQIFNKFIAMALMEFIFSLCLTLYNFSQPDVPLFDYYYLSIIVLVEFQYVAVLFTASICLHSVVSVFLAQIQDRCFGFTTWSIYLLTKSFMCTVIGTLMTYGVIVFQFQVAPNSDTCVCNVTT